MALSSLRLRRTLTLTTSLLKTSTSPSLSPKLHTYSSIAHPRPINPSNPSKNYLKTQTFGFRSSLPSPSSRSSSFRDRDDDEKISEDTILFEGCDYNHWLITMDFPKDPKPTPEEMVETYVQTLAKVVGSVEEAKKRMYACSTTTYNGFQAVMDEETSEKFRGLPGVVFILPDSYIDPVNKEYGGDKYVNGTIIPRPPPIQMGRVRGRYDDRNRRPQVDVRNYGTPQNFAQGPPQGDVRNYGRPQNFAQGPPRGDGRNYGPPPPQNFAQGPPAQGDGRNYEAQQNYQPQQSFAPNPAGQDGRGIGGHPNYATQQNYGPRPTGQVERRDGYPTGNNSYAYGGRDSYQGERRDAIPPNQGDFTQAGRRDYGPSENRGDFRGDNRNFSPPPAGDYRQGTGPSLIQGHPGSNQGQGFQQMDQRSGLQGQQNFTPMGQTQNDQGGY